jgi:hypothetical protein
MRASNIDGMHAWMHVMDAALLVFSIAANGDVHLIMLVYAPTPP